MNFLKTLVYACLIGSLLTGCASTRKLLNFDTAAKLEFSASKQLNPDNDGRPSPLVVTVIKLQDKRNFERQDFLSLYENPQESLGADYLGRVRLQEILPGGKHTETLELDENVKYLGLIAEYTQYDKAKTTALIAIEPHKTNTYSIQLLPLKITVDK